MEKLITLFLPAFLFSQMSDKPQFGFGIRGTINILPIAEKWRAKNEPRFGFRISASAGVGGRWVSDNIYPSLNAELQLYNGGIGGSYRPSESADFPVQLDAVIAFTVTSGFVNTSQTDYSQLRYFADFATPSLRNPYKSSLSLGTNLVLTTDSKREYQRLGFINFNVQGIQLSYYNDGGLPIRQMRLGDREDRYYTGGGTLSYDMTDRNFPLSIEVSAHKFTGFTKSAFDFSNATKSKTVRYKDLDQYSYNKSVLRVNVYSLNNDKLNYGISASYFNWNRFDVQHFIHKFTSNAYHVVLNKEYLFIEPIIMYNHNSKP